MNSANFNTQMIQLSGDLRDAQRALEAQVRMFAFYERLYRRERAKAYLKTTAKTVGEREALVDLCAVSGDLGIPEDERRPEPDTILDLRYLRDIAEGLKVAKLELVRSIRQQLSALQSLANLAKEEAAFDRVGPQDAA